MRFTLCIHKDEGTDYGVTVPDLPGCFSAGATIDEALDMAKEAIEFHCQSLLEDGEAIPEAQAPETHVGNPDYAGGFWAFVDVDAIELMGKIDRFNVTMPALLVRHVDAYVEAHKNEFKSRSDMLTKLAARYLDQTVRARRSNALPAAKKESPKRAAGKRAKAINRTPVKPAKRA